MLKKLLLISSTIVVLVAIVAIYQYQQVVLTSDSEIVNPPIQNTATLTIGSSVLKVEIADTDELRTRGLSGRARLAPKTGMLFVFDKPGFYGFWMKDMKFPLDIIWIDENWHIVDITQNATPESYPHSFIPAGPAKYVVEVAPGSIPKSALGTIVTKSN